MLKNLLLVVTCGALAYCALTNTTRPVTAAPEKTTPAIFGAPFQDHEDAVPKGYTLGRTREVGGLWVQRDYNGPFAAVYSQQFGKEKVAVFGLSRNQKGTGHEFAIVASDKEIYFQIRDAKGDFWFIPVEALTKLAGGGAPVKAQPMGVAK